MKRVLIGLLLIPLSCSSGRSQKAAAIEELYSGAREFLQQHYASADTHFRKAQALDPSYKFTQLLIARTLHAEYKPSDRSPENISRAHAAIDAYKKYLEVDPANYLARDAVSFLYDRLQEGESQKQWLLDCGRSEKFSNDRRAECYTVIASKEWDCSFRFTSLHAKEGTGSVRANDPAAVKAAEQCASSGLDTIDKAIALDPNNAAAWSYKANLLLELAKLAEMQGQDKAAYSAQATESQNHARALLEKAGKQESPVSAIDRSVKTGDAQLDEVINTPYFSLEELVSPRKG
jgi:Tetratricopeptide repeat